MTCFWIAMKRWIIIWMLALTLTNTQGQEANSFSPEPNSVSSSRYLKPYLSLNNHQENELMIQKLERLIYKLEKSRKRKKTDYAFLRSIFYKTHTSLLHEYERLATMDETLKTGKFGCLTGTAIYAIILEHFGYKYRIIELPNHVFIHLSLEDTSYVFESTLQFGGFMRTTAEMDKLLKQPWVSHRNITKLSTVGEWFTDFQMVSGNYKVIDLKALAGLQYFNEAAKLYQIKNYVEAMDLAFEAYQLYPSERNDKLMQLIINKILKYDTIGQDIKIQYLDQYVSSIKSKKLSQTK